tara:strand:- start:34 stop:489 length:456 start_codon:yes stop_codon:yes gene_type:complete
MENLKKMLMIENQPQFLLALLFIFYILFNVEMPKNLAKMINTNVGNAVVLVIALSLFYHTQPVVGILGLIVAYELIRRAGHGIAAIDVKNHLPSENVKEKVMENVQPPNQGNLEEQTVKNMVPLVGEPVTTPAEYKPIADVVHGASSFMKD